MVGRLEACPVPGGRDGRLEGFGSLADREQRVADGCVHRTRGRSKRVTAPQSLGRQADPFTQPGTRESAVRSGCPKAAVGIRHDSYRRTTAAARRSDPT
jgi:hypothetical protein